MDDPDTEPDSVALLKEQVPNLYFYVITASDGHPIDREHETNYLVVNGYEEALDKLEGLPEGSYLLHSCEVDTTLAWLELVSTRMA